MVEAKLAEAFAKVHKALGVPDGAFNDEAGDALNLCRRSFREALDKAPEALDKAQGSPDMILTFQFLLKVQEKKSIRRSQVKSAIGFLFERDVWLFTVAKDEETKTKLLEFLSQYADMKEVSEKLEAGPPKDDPKAKAKAKAAAAPAADAGAAGDAEAEAAEAAREQTPEDITRRLLLDGLEGFRECDFIYPTGLHTEQKSDDALEAFSSNFYMGVSRLATTVATLETKRGEGADTSEYEGMIRDIPDEEIPKILNFLVTLWEARTPWRNKAVYVVNKLEEVSPRFRHAVDNRSGRLRRLPWLSALPAEEEAAPPLPTKSKVISGNKCTVVWIDGRASAYQSDNIKMLTDAGMSVVGFHDDWSRGHSNATELAESYLVEAIMNPAEHVIAIIVNNGPLHKQMLKNIVYHSAHNGRVPPLCLACTMKGQYVDFEGCGVTFVSPDRNAIQRVAVEEYSTRAAGGHRFEVGDSVATLYWRVGPAWTRAKVQTVDKESVTVNLIDGEGKLVEGTPLTIPVNDYGLWVRSLSPDSIFNSIAVGLPVAGKGSTKGKGY